MKWLLLVLAACDHHSVTSCSDDLQGVYATPAGERWMVLDEGKRLEAYPMFDDASGSAAPRFVELARGDRLAGTMARRFGDACAGKAPFHVVACGANALDVVYAVPASCVAALPSRAERWRLLR